MSTWQNLFEKTGNHTSQAGHFVLDASIVVKWFYEEADSDLALEIFDAIHSKQIVCLSPDILISELANALWKGKKAPKTKVLEALSDLQDSGIKFIRLHSGLITGAVEVMVKYNLSFYDATYAGLAKVLNLPLISANPKDHGKVKEIKILSLK